MMTIGTRSQFQAAIDRAQGMGGARRAQPLGDGRYRVVGRRGDAYTARVDAAGEWSCTCPAGANGRPCWHQGCAWLKHLGARPAPATNRAAAPYSRPSGRGIGLGDTAADDEEGMAALVARMAPRADAGLVREEWV